MQVRICEDFEWHNAAVNPHTGQPCAKNLTSCVPLHCEEGLPKGLIDPESGVVGATMTLYASTAARSTALCTDPVPQLLTLPALPRGRYKIQPGSGLGKQMVRRTMVSFQVRARLHLPCISSVSHVHLLCISFQEIESGYLQTRYTPPYGFASYPSLLELGARYYVQLTQVRSRLHLLCPPSPPHRPPPSCPPPLPPPRSTRPAARPTPSPSASSATTPRRSARLPSTANPSLFHS